MTEPPSNVAITEIHNLADLAAVFDVESGESQKITQDLIIQAVHKYTKDCIDGEIWIAFGALGIQIGGAIPGYEHGSRIYGLTYPFGKIDLVLCIAAIAAQIDRLRAWLNDEREVGEQLQRRQ